MLTGHGLDGRGADGRGKARDRWESLQALVSQAEEFAAEQPTRR